MPNPEQSGSHRPLYPTALPPELAAFLRESAYVCVSETTDQGTVMVIKVPTADLESLRGPVPILLQQALYAHPAAPVIQMTVHIFDQPASPLALETFYNIADPAQHERYAALATQTHLPLLFYDDTLTHQLTKVVPYHQQQETAATLTIAERLVGLIPPDEYNFDLAKAAVMRTSRL
jgi:hypothetical protein